jgi:hypothetical protein
VPMFHDAHSGVLLASVCESPRLTPLEVVSMMQRDDTALLGACCRGLLPVVQWLVLSAGASVRTERDIVRMCGLVLAAMRRSRCRCGCGCGCG